MSDIDKITIRVPTELKKELQIIAIQNDTNMSEIIKELLTDYVKEYNSKLYNKQ